jgi:chemosensory pili system protein ChpA (sensor histidine kinase/response regulator)
MDQFSLDDARETFAADVGAALDRIARAGAALLELPELAAADAARPRPFAQVDDACHTITGTAALLRVGSLATGAGWLAELARDGAACLERIAAEAAKARAIAQALAVGGEGMRRVLELELAGRGAAVEGVMAELARELAPLRPAAHQEDHADDLLVVVLNDTERIERERLERERAAPAEFSFEEPAAPAPDSERGFDFGAIDAEPAPPATLGEELCAIFRQEAQEFVPELRDSFAALAGDQRDVAAARRLQRIYHTLKGASASAGMGEVSGMASALEEAVEQALASGHGPASDQLAILLRETNGLLRASGLGEIAMVVMQQRGSSTERCAKHASSVFYLKNAGDPSTQLLHVFCLESALTMGAITDMLGRLRDAEFASQEWNAHRDELARLFHLLKGSAVVANQSRTVALAAQLQERCRTRAVDRGLAAALEPGVAELERLVGKTMGDIGLNRPTVPQPAAPRTAERAVAAPATERAAVVPATTAQQAQPVRPRTAAIAATQREAVGTAIDQALWESFAIEASELLQSIDRAAAALSGSGQPQRELAELFRLVHTLKGSVNTVGLAPLGRYLHRFEDFLEGLESATILPPPRAVAALADTVLGTMRANLTLAGHGYVEVDHARLERELQALGQGGSPGAAEPRAGADSTHAQPPSGARVLADAGQDQVERKFVRVPTARLDGLMNLTGELVVSRSRIGKRLEGLRAVQRELDERKGRLLETIGGFRERYEFSTTRAGLRLPSDPARPPRPGDAAADAPAAQGTPALRALFSDLELDRYEDINILSRSLAEIGDDIAALHGQFANGCSSLAEDITAFGGSVAGLQAEITRTRMVAVDQLFARMRLPVNDAAAREGKEARLVTTGGDAALDKAIVDGLHGALLHLVRNAVAHGIESPEARAAAGKPRAGTITLAARQDSGQVLLTVADDGAGLDLAALQRRGVERGLIAPDTALDDAAVRDLIFVPGLSTRASATDLSGRGIGCDVVRREIERLGGHLVVATAAGQGTTFSITLPVTLAITRALMVGLGGRTYAIPLGFAERIADLGELATNSSLGRTRVRIDDAYVALRPLGEVLELADQGPGGVVIVLRVGEARTAISVDRVLGQEEIVVKRLENVLAGHPLFSAVTVSADGEPLLILDVPGLFGRGGHAEASPRQRAAAPAEPEAARPEAPAGRRLRVLFVDDSLSVRKVAERFLGALGTEVVLANDGVDALAKLRQGAFDMVFTDLEMPRMHGYDLIREIRFVPAYRELPVVVVTSRSGQKHRAQAEAVGANAYLTKPFTQEALQQMLAAWGGAAVR